MRSRSAQVRELERMATRLAAQRATALQTARLDERAQIEMRLHEGRSAQHAAGQFRQHRHRPVRWLSIERGALDTLVLLGGREGIGRSTVAHQLVADLTQGRLPGRSYGTPKAVIIAATEDCWEHTIVPRLIAASANLELVPRVDVETDAGFKTGFSLPRDLAALGK